MTHYVFLNRDKKFRAEEAIAEQGMALDSDGEQKQGGHFRLYKKIKEANPEISDKELLLEIYRGLGGDTKELESAHEIKEFEAEEKKRAKEREKKFKE
mgnify:CR=1 FL=1